jgi:hypothetical protein
MSAPVQCTLLVAIALAATAALAQDLADPLRPPNARPEKESAAAPALTGSGLRGIWSVGSRRYAVLDNQVVEVGTRIGEQRVTRITDTEVTLTGPEGPNTLSIAIGIEKTVKKPTTAVAARAAKGAQSRRVESSK